jgi:hypothetical protein
MTRLTIVIDVENVDPTLQDPHDVAEDALDYRSMRISFARPIEFVSAQWGDALPEADDA